MRLETARGVVIARTKTQSTMCHGQSQIGYLANYINLNDGRSPRPAVTQLPSWLHAEFEGFRVVIRAQSLWKPRKAYERPRSVRRSSPGLGSGSDAIRRAWSGRIISNIFRRVSRSSRRSPFIAMRNRGLYHYDLWLRLGVVYARALARGDRAVNRDEG